jgi:hypothetical protein
MFLDGKDLMSPELTRAIDDIARGYKGFLFGRFDIRGEDESEIRLGRGFRIIELNGVTSESTHIYQPGTSLFEAYRTLFSQWHLAFQIGKEQTALGHRATGILSLLRSLMARVGGKS